MQDTDQNVGKSLPRISKFVENYIPKGCDKMYIKFQLLQKVEFKLVLKFYFNLML